MFSKHVHLLHWLSLDGFGQVSGIQTKANFKLCFEFAVWVSPSNDNITALASLYVYGFDFLLDSVVGVGNYIQVHGLSGFDLMREM